MPMKESEWLTCTDSRKMLAFLREGGQLTERRSRLFGAAACRRVWHLLPDARSRKAVEVAERYGQAGATDEELEAAYEEAFDVGAALAESGDEGRAALRCAAWAACGTAHPDELAEAVAQGAAEAAGTGEEEGAQANLLRCVFGNPFRSIALDPSWLTWNGCTVQHLAQAAYDNRTLPAGTLDNDRLAVLADALEDAGCNDTDLLNHFRLPSVHVRGCWGVDLVLGKV
jgi:hypothetical protein